MLVLENQGIWRSSTEKSPGNYVEMSGWTLISVIGRFAFHATKHFYQIKTRNNVIHNIKRSSMTKLNLHLNKVS